jgi:hypothetical protein
MDVNALNYCRFSLLLQPTSVQSSESNEALIALPNLVESSLVRTADESNNVIFFHISSFCFNTHRLISGLCPHVKGCTPPLVKTGLCPLLWTYYPLMAEETQRLVPTSLKPNFKISLFILACRSDHVHASVYHLYHCFPTLQL